MFGLFLWGNNAKIKSLWKRLPTNYPQCQTGVLMQVVAPFIIFPVQRFNLYFL